VGVREDLGDLNRVIDDSLHAVLRAAADAGPTASANAMGSTVVLHHADVERLAHDTSLVGIGLALFDLMGIDDGPLRDWYGGLMFTNEGEPHQRLRSLVSRAFTPRSVGALRPTAAAAVDRALSRVRSDGGGDLVEAVGLVPMEVMCALLGVPAADVPEFVAWADALSTTFGLMDPDQIVAAHDAIQGMLSYVTRLADLRHDRPADDVITALLAVADDGERLTHEEAVAMVANLIVGGHDTTASQLGCSLLALLRHPDQLARVRAEPEVVPSAVVETIRYEPSVAFVPRRTTGAFELAGTELPADSILLLATAAANREPGVWDEPDRFDVGRFTSPDAPRLLSFGAGPHYCLGAALARLTVEEVVRGVAALGEGLTPAKDLTNVDWRMVLGRSPATLPVTLTT
jgi:cytochrome P450